MAFVLVYISTISDAFELCFNGAAHVLAQTMAALVQQQQQEGHFNCASLQCVCVYACLL